MNLSNSVCLLFCILQICNSATVKNTLLKAIESKKQPIINKFLISTNVTNRFAETLVTSFVKNDYDVPKETTFTVVLPDSAYVTGFSMVINGQEYKSFIDDVDVVKKSYSPVTYHGAAGISIRDSNEFDVVINLEPKKTTILKLFYEELLERKQFKYEIISNIFPNQLVEVMGVEIFIKEDEKIDFVNKPYLRTGNEILNSTFGLDTNTLVTKTDHLAHIKFTPGLMEQFKLACHGLGDRDSFGAQFIVEYDIDRTSQSQVLANDGYFINFFAPPATLQALTKHLVFILDTSGSMSSENRLNHLKSSMKLISEMLKADDFFSIISFSTSVKVWNIEDKTSIDFSYSIYPYLSPSLQTTDFPPAFKATPDNIQKGIDVVDNFRDLTSTNIIGALTVGYEVVQRTASNFSNDYTPMIVFLSDGEPNEGLSDTDEIADTFKGLNILKVPVYAISLGESANRPFSTKLSLENKGFEVHVYDGKDANKQLSDFYSRISAPLIKDLKYENLEGITDMSESNQALVFNGTEVKAAGKGGYWHISKSKPLNFTISGQSSNGHIEFKSTVKVPSTKLEKLWAFLTVKNLIGQLRVNPAAKDIRDKALNISLTYSLLTDVTALVVVKPNIKNSVNLNNAYKGSKITVSQNPICRSIPWPTSTTSSPLTSTTTAPTTTSASTETTVLNSTTTISTTSPSTTTTTQATTTTTQYPDPCNKLPNRALTCNQKKIGYYYDGTNCKRFRGCDIAFQQKIDCESACLKTFDSCDLMMDSGTCTPYNITKWYYSVSDDKCKQFSWGGCGGNSNRFETSDECERTCVLTFDKCLQSMVQGPCTNFKSMWYYDININECTPFDYGGCKGNGNKFLTKQTCESLCKINSS